MMEVDFGYEARIVKSVKCENKRDIYVHMGCAVILIGICHQS